MAPSWHAKVKAYRERREGFASRRDYLVHLASGPDLRQDVEAARRLLATERYADPNSPIDEDCAASPCAATKTVA